MSDSGAVGWDDTRDGARWWKLYRQERRKIATFKTRLTDQQIVRASREATRRFVEEKP